MAARTLAFACTLDDGLGRTFVVDDTGAIYDLVISTILASLFLVKYSTRRFEAMF